MVDGVINAVCYQHQVLCFAAIYAPPSLCYAASEFFHARSKNQEFDKALQCSLKKRRI